MLHEMNLHDDPFVFIKMGYKDIEMRLNDEKRKKIKVGDIIEFTIKDTLDVNVNVKMSASPFLHFYYAIYNIRYEN